MSRNPNTRLQRRDERAARHPGNAQRARRDRGSKTAVRGPGGGIPLTTIFIGAGVVAIVAMLFYAVTQSNNTDSGPPKWLTAQLDDSTDLPGVYYAPHPGADGVFDSGTNPASDDRLHSATGANVPICTEQQIADNKLSDPSYGAAGVCYTSNPPTSGPHSNTPAQFKNLENPGLKEDILHSMEHGGVYIWYNTDDQAAIDMIKSVVNDNVDRRRFVGSTVYAGMEPGTIAITSWTRLDKFSVSELTRDRLQDFIDAHHKRFNPEGF